MAGNSLPFKSGGISYEDSPSVGSLSEMAGRFRNNFSGATAQNEFNSAEAEKARVFNSAEAQKDRDWHKGKT